MVGLIGGMFRGVAAKTGDYIAFECFVEVDARFRGVLIRNTNVGTGRQGITTTAC